MMGAEVLASRLRQLHHAGEMIGGLHLHCKDIHRGEECRAEERSVGWKAERVE